MSKLKMFSMFSLPCRNGYNMWRDAFKPTQILDSLCKKNSLPAAEYRWEEVKVDNKIFKVPPEAFPEGTECSENNDLSFKQLPVVSSAHASEMWEGWKPSSLSSLECPTLCPAWLSFLGHHGEHPWCSVGSFWFQWVTVLYWGKMLSRLLDPKAASQAVGGAE